MERMPRPTGNEDQKPRRLNPISAAVAGFAALTAVAAQSPKAEAAPAHDGNSITAVQKNPEAPAPVAARPLDGSTAQSQPLHSEAATVAPGTVEKQGLNEVPMSAQPLDSVTGQPVAHSETQAQSLGHVEAAHVPSEVVQPKDLGSGPVERPLGQ